MRRLVLTLLLTCLPLAAQSPAAPNAATDPFAPLRFLLGTWSAKAEAAGGTAGAESFGNYTFRLDLGGHAIERTGSPDSCKGPQSFDCDHHDRLTIFSDPNAMAAHHASLLAFYLDNEGHVIYYTVSLPDPHTVVFNSQNAAGTPRFRLTYHLEGDGPKAVMSGKFQFAPPGSDEYHSYLEWNGTRQ